MMTQKQQQRLIGTLLLVFFIAVLAYIVLSKVSQTESGRQVQEEEPIQFSSVIEALQEETDDESLMGDETSLAEEAFVDIGSADTENIPQSSVSDKPVETDSSTEKTPEPEIISEKPAPAPKPEPEPVAETPEPSPPPVSQPEPSTSADSASRWILQLGSFSVEANATSLKKQLEDIGYKPMIEQTRSGETVIYRVRLQPDADRATLERTAASIREQLNLNTQIFPYP
ncbi:MAG: hypothetical protein CMH21_00250 [Methylophaga sp.]|jgi:DedD protein|uniref:SPOR domain-containing protein n=4 Tax=Methylophaga TaxID=40222 RepID=UPI000C91FF5E|nr:MULTISPECIES: SPOR domain-containing protein [unclassified Methylophaga]MAK65437.1 hypothetical protein [Methylophaga sp.]MAY16160.1 hypothetical protein [Methylophaga sp.]|tara:strand:+ start:5880 stop:6563 length:684 start_codon:yes stop_codon:yes gene_type:complete